MVKCVSSFTYSTDSRGLACVLWAGRLLLLSNPDSVYQLSRIAHNLPIAEVTSQSNNQLAQGQCQVIACCLSGGHGHEMNADWLDSAVINDDFD